MKQAATLITSALLLSSTTTLAVSPKLLSQEAIKDEAPAVEAVVFPEGMPAEVMFKILSAEMALSRGHHQLALTNYIDVAEETQDAKVAQRATQVALGLADLETAYVPGKIWAKADPENLESQITFTAILLRMGKTEEAQPYMQQTMQLDPIDSDRHFVMLFKQLPDEKERTNVIAALEILSQKAKENLPLVALADIALYENRVPNGIAFAKEALERTPNDSKAIILYTQGMMQNQQVEEGIAFMAAKVEELPKNVHIRQFYTQFLIDSHQYEKARSQIQVLMTLDGLANKQKLQLARLCMQAKWYEEAQALLMDVRSDPVHQASAHYFLGRMFESQKDHVQAANWYSQVGPSPFHIIALIRASMLYMDLKEYQQALTIVDSAQPQNYSDLKRLLLARIDILLHAQRHQEAFEVLSNAIRSEPEDPDFLYSRAILAEKLDKLDVVEQDLQTILKEDPNHIDALNAYGFILANRTERYDEAMNYITKALDLSPNNPSILDSLGWLQYKMGQPEQALKTLKKALSLFPNPEIAAHLGEVLWSVEKHDEAQEVWQKALQLNPDDKDLLNTMERLIGNNGH